MILVDDGYNLASSYGNGGMREKEIKIKVLEYVFKRFKDVVAVPEVSMGQTTKMNMNGAKRADVFAVDGGITIFEIKSEKDSLKRLDDQLRIYTRFADKVNVVVADRFIDKLDIDERIGVFSYSKRGIKMVREAKRFQMEAEAYLSYWWGIELKKFFRGCGFKELHLEAAHARMRELLTDDQIARVTIFRLKERYRQESETIKKLLNKKEYDALFPKRPFTRDIKVTPLKDLPFSIVTGLCER